MKLAADDVQTLVIPGCAHLVAAEAPEGTLAAHHRLPGAVPEGP
jgi:hypothetical protein